MVAAPIVAAGISLLGGLFGNRSQRRAEDRARADALAAEERQKINNSSAHAQARADAALLQTVSAKDSHREFMCLDGAHEQAITRPLPHDELVQLHGVFAQARIPDDLVGQ